MPKQQNDSSLEQKFDNDAFPIFPVPKIQLDPVAETKIWDVVQRCEYEAGWLGTVIKIPSGYLIQDIYCLDQAVNEIHNSLGPEGLKTLYRQLLDDGAAGFDKLERLYFWGHSHVTMPELPSHTDRTTMIKVWAQSKRPVVIMGIFNKIGKAWFSIYDFAHGIIYDRVKIQRPIMDDERLAQEVDAEFASIKF